MAAKNKLLVVQVAALGLDVAQNHGTSVADLKFSSLIPVFPAVTCAVQAALRTGLDCSGNGMPGNGYFDRTLCKPLFWEQSAGIVEGPRIWRRFREAGGTVGMLFWQQSLGEEVDLVLSPAPIHKHHGGMIQDCYSQPEGLYRELCRRIGRRFNLMHYWGPMASVKSSAWSAAATVEVMGMDNAPQLLFTYLSGLDYDLLRHGPASPHAGRAWQAVGEQLARLLEAAARHGYETIVFGDYAIRSVQTPVYPNRILREHGFMHCRAVNRMLYPDLYRSPAFALVDHEIAHLYLKNPAVGSEVGELMRNTEGVAAVLDGRGKAEAGVDHPRAGDLVLVASPGCWFAYPWWGQGEKEPDYASHVDIHNKPGFDPCELFFGWPPLSVGRNPARVGGSHGAVDPHHPAAWSSTWLEPTSLHQLELAKEIEAFIDL